ncbi:MAG: TlpA family protein disulfide reductase [Planctomycetes bacterium]|nr:TlpA family protein disulfide reductase [Planctomycetota bacterium]
MMPRRYEQLPEPIVFRSEGRRAVKTPADLALGEGDRAPDFTLPTLDGKSITLSDLRGRVVVLDFWASWCGPCRLGLPLLDKFAAWARTEGAPVEVFAVNFGERRRTAEGRREIATRYWKQAGYTVPVLLDLDNSVATAFEVGPIPHMVVIGPDGTILDVEVGLNMSMTSHLKELTNQALGKTG